MTAEQEKTDIIKRIFESLTKSGKSQKELSEYIGISPNSITSWKNGSLPAADRIPYIAKFFGVTTDYILTGQESSSNSASNVSNSSIVQGNYHVSTLIIKNGKTTEREITEQEIELLRIFNSLNIKQKIGLLSEAYEMEESQK